MNKRCCVLAPVALSLVALSPALAVAALLLVAGCTASPAPVPPVPAACPRVTLVEPPLWTGGGAWDAAGERLVLVDPGQAALMAYEPLTGRPVAQAAAGTIAHLDLTNPVRLSAQPDGFLLGDRAKLVRLTPGLSPRGAARDPFAGLPVLSGILGDHLLVGRRLYAYADLQRDEENWVRGLMAIDLAAPEAPRPGDSPSADPPSADPPSADPPSADPPSADPGGDYRVLAPMPLTKGGEFERYYRYEHRPYVAALGREVFFLRFTDPPRIERVTTRRGRPAGLDPLPLPALEEDEEAIGLHGWRDALWLVTQCRDRPDVSGLAPPEAALMIQAAESFWALLRLDRRGRLVARIDLPTSSPRLTVVPGERHWGLVEEKSSPNMGQEGSITSLLRLPAERLEELGGDPAGGDPASGAARWFEELAALCRAQPSAGAVRR